MSRKLSISIINNKLSNLFIFNFRQMSLFQLSTVFLPTTFLICAITVNHERSLKILCIPHFDVETA